MHGHDDRPRSVARTVTDYWFCEIPQDFRDHKVADALASLPISLIAMVFSLAIAVASGAPPMAGITSSIIAGFIFRLVGGGHVLVSGPAAGLASVLLSAMLLLGEGDLARGYPLLGAAICCAGGLQVCWSLLAMYCRRMPEWLKPSGLTELFPKPVISGMLAGIGLLIILKQVPALFGHASTGHGFGSLIHSIVAAVQYGDPTVTLIGAASLAVVVGLGLLKPYCSGLKLIPPHLVGVVVGTALAVGLGLSASHRIQIPADPLQHGLVMPNFVELFSGNLSRLLLVGWLILQIDLVDSVESLATARAMDAKSPPDRQSSPNRLLLAMGVSNICSSLLGGLTIIPGGVKSTACVQAGGRTLWVNAFCSLLLVLYLVCGREVINLIPLTALAAILIYTGAHLCEWRVWREAWRDGTESLAMFCTAAALTVATDLLYGVLAGCALKALCMAARAVLPSVPAPVTPELVSAEADA